MLINEFLKLLPFEITADEFIALIISVSIIIGTFEACHHQAQKAEEFYKEKKQHEIYIFEGEPGAGMSLNAILPNQSEMEREANGSN